MDADDFRNNLIPYKNIMYRLAKRLLKNTEDAEDAVQDTFARLWIKRENLDSGRNLQALTMITLKNICLDKLKSGNSKILPMIDDENFLPGKDNPQNQLEKKDIRHKINSIIETMPEPQKMIIHLRDIEGMSNDEVSEIVQMNKNAVKVALSRARKKLKEELVKQLEYINYEN